MISRAVGNFRRKITFPEIQTNKNAKRSFPPFANVSIESAKCKDWRPIHIYKILAMFTFHSSDFPVFMFTVTSFNPASVEFKLFSFTLFLTVFEATFSSHSLRSPPIGSYSFQAVELLGKTNRRTDRELWWVTLTLAIRSTDWPTDWPTDLHTDWIWQS